jgi:hypothetical protein
VCGCVRVFECMLSIVPLLGIVQPILLRVLASPFIVCKERDRVTVFGCTKIERKCPKVLPIPSFSLSSCIRTASSRWWQAMAVDDAVRPYPDTVS